MMIKTLIAAAVIAASAAAPAAAENFRFRYSAHELQTEGGRAELMSRLDRQVSHYCDANTFRHLAGERAMRTCRKELTAEIVTRIDSVALAGLQR